MRRMLKAVRPDVKARQKTAWGPAGSSDPEGAHITRYKRWLAGESASGNVWKPGRGGARATRHWTVASGPGCGIPSSSGQAGSAHPSHQSGVPVVCAAKGSSEQALQRRRCRVVSKRIFAHSVEHTLRANGLVNNARTRTRLVLSDTLST